MKQLLKQYPPIYKESLGEMILPHCEEAEVAVLGSIIMDSSCMNEVIQIINEQMFYSQANATLFQSMYEMFAKNIFIDLITLKDYLLQQNRLDSVGGLIYLMELAEGIYSVSSITHHAQMVRKRFGRRQLIQAADRIYQSAMQRDELPELLEEAGRSILDIVVDRQENKIYEMSDILPEVLQEMEDDSKHPGTLKGLPSGLNALDQFTCGFQKPDLIILAAYPSMGKTSLMMKSAVSIASQNKPVLIFSCEMPPKNLIYRQICTATRIQSEKIKKGYISKSNWEQIGEYVLKLSRLPIFIDFTPGLSVMELKAKAIQWKIKVPNLAMIFQDYVQLMNGPKEAENRNLEMSAISKTCVEVAKRLDVPFMILSQLNSNARKRGKYGRFDGGDLRDSGTLSEDADVLIFIGLTPPPDNATEQEKYLYQNRLTLQINKQRNGPTGDAHVLFQREYTDFQDLAPSSLTEPTSQEEQVNF